MVSNIPISVGLLLGLSAGAYGTALRQVEKVLSVHIPALHPPASADMEVPYTIQTAALLGIGLLLATTEQRRITEVLLGVIPATKAEVQYKEAFSFSAGVALGLVCLGKGNFGVGLADLNVTDQLLAFVHGGRLQVKQTTNAASTSTTSENTKNMAWFSTSHLPGNSASSRSAAGTIDRSSPEGFVSNHGKPEKASLNIEGNSINVNVTAPAAIYSLALMYLKTNEAGIASKLEIPTTLFLLEQIRPDLLLLRTMAKNLILWDSIVPTDQWILLQLPPFVRNVASTLETNPNMILAMDEENGETLKQSYVNIVSGTFRTVSVLVLVLQLLLFTSLQP